MFAHNEDPTVRMFEMFLLASGWHRTPSDDCHFWHWNGREVYTYSDHHEANMIGFSIADPGSPIAWATADEVSVDMRAILEQPHHTGHKGYREMLHDNLFEVYVGLGKVEGVYPDEDDQGTAAGVYGRNE